MQEVIIFEPAFSCRCDVAGDNGNAFMSILHCCPKTGFCFQFVISLELWVELLERDSQPPRTKPTIKIKEKVQTGSFNKEDITVKSVVRLRATSQYCHAMLVFWLAVCSEQVAIQISICCLSKRFFILEYCELTAMASNITSVSKREKVISLLSYNIGYCWASGEISWSTYGVGK